MKKLMMIVAALAFASTALVGCRAGAEIDPDGRVSYNTPAIR